VLLTFLFSSFAIGSLLLWIETAWVGVRVLRYGDQCLSHFRMLHLLCVETYPEWEIILRKTWIWNTKHEMDHCVVWVCNNKKETDVGHKLCIMERHTPRENCCVRVGFLCHTMFQDMYTPYKAFYVVLVFRVCASAYG